jgi:membrane protease YdiL (CAAX protease family)
MIDRSNDVDYRPSGGTRTRRPGIGQPESGPQPIVFLGGFLAIWGTLYALGAPTATGIELGAVAMVATIGVAALIEHRASGVPLRELAGTLGLGRPTARSMIAGGVTAVAVAAVLPLYAWLADIELHVRDDWFWLTLALVAYHGVAEEVAWRGYAFAHLRRRTTFWRAVAWTMPLLALTHFPVIVESGPAVGAAAVAVAAITCIPLAHLYEIGRGTIWAAVLVHSAIDGFKLLDDPGAEPRITLGITLAATVLPLAALAWARRRVTRPPMS